MSVWKKLAIGTAQFAIILIFFSSTKSYARPSSGGNFGLGIIVGDPSAGISLKRWTGSTTAIDGAISWNGNWIQLHADYLIHLPHIIRIERGSLPVYYGVGVFIQSYKKQALGIRIPIGLSYEVPQNPIEAFVEIVPKLTLVETSSFRIGAGVGARFYF